MRLMRSNLQSIDKLTLLYLAYFTTIKSIIKEIKRDLRTLVWKWEGEAPLRQSSDEDSFSG